MAGNRDAVRNIRRPFQDGNLPGGIGDVPFDEAVTLRARFGL